MSITLKLSISKGYLKLRPYDCTIHIYLLIKITLNSLIPITLKLWISNGYLKLRSYDYTYLFTGHMQIALKLWISNGYL